MATIKQARTAKKVYQLRIELADVQPTVRRTLWVPDTIKVSRLDKVMQAAFGWANKHLHEFRIAGRRYGQTDFADRDDRELLDERLFTLEGVVGTSVREFIHDYDFGDGWRHRILVEHIIDANEYNNWPLCVDGENACPPEDVGGPHGYAAFVALMADPTREDYLEMWRWHGGPFNPEAFEISAANMRIRKIGG